MKTFVKVKNDELNILNKGDYHEIIHSFETTKCACGKAIVISTETEDGFSNELSVFDAELFFE